MKLPALKNFLEKFRRDERPPFERYYLLAFILFIAFLVGDLVTLSLRQYLLPTAIPPKKAASTNQPVARSYTYPDVIKNNIFNSDRVIPPSRMEIEGGTGDNATPRLSELPLDLIGTIVHANPQRSLATINLRGQNKVEPFAVGQEISGMAEIKEIQRERVIFRNLQTQALEYIHIPQEQKIVLSTEKGPTASLPAPTGEKTDFSFKRADIDQQLTNLPALLQQARVVPEIGPDGQVKGYCMAELQPGSIYEKLGLRIGDCLRAANGEPINSPQKAMQLYQSLKNSNDIKLEVDRGGRAMNMNYNLTQ